MMFHVQAASRNHCALLAVVCGKIPVSEDQQQHPYPFPELVSSGRLEVCVSISFLSFLLETPLLRVCSLYLDA